MNAAFEAAGSFNKFQKIVCYLVISLAIMNAIQCISYPFLTSQPEFLCRDKSNIVEDYYECHNKELCKNELFDYKINREKSLNNISLEFDLYCERGIYVGIIGTSFFIGGIFGSFLLSPIPDKYGRSGIYKILLTASLLLNLNMLLSFSVYHVIITNFIAGFVYYSTSMVTFIVTEYLPQSASGKVISLTSSIDPLTGIFITFYFKYVNNWRLLFGLASIYSLILSLVVNFYFLESPRWLNSKNRVKESIEILKQIADINGNKKSFDNFLKQNSQLIKGDENLKEIKTTYTLFQILQLKSQRLNIICLAYLWFCCGLLYYGLVMNLEHLGGNIFLNGIVLFIGEISSELSTGVLADHYGRILIFKVCGLIGGISFIIWELIGGDNWFRVILVFMTSFGFSGIYNLIYIYSPEIFPTSIRSTVLGFLFLVNRFGAIIVPYTPYIPHSPILFGILSLFSVYVDFHLKETLGIEPPDDIPEAMKQTSFLSNSNTNKLNVSKSHIFTKRLITSENYFKNEVI